MTQAISDVSRSSAPDVSVLQREGWAIISATGPYYTVWRECEEHLLLWKDGHWHAVDGHDSPFALSTSEAR